MANLIDNGEGYSLTGWTGSGATTSANGFIMTGGNIEQTNGIDPEESVDVYRLDFEITAYTKVIDSMCHVEVSAIYALPENPPPGAVRERESYFCLVYEKGKYEIDLIFQPKKGIIEEFYISVFGYQFTIKDLYLRVWLTLTVSDKKEVKDETAAAIDETVAGMAGHIILDHEPTESDISGTNINDIILVYDPAVLPFVADSQRAAHVVTSVYVIKQPPTAISACEASFYDTGRILSYDAKLTIDWNDGSPVLDYDYQIAGLSGWVAHTHTYTDGYSHNAKIYNLTAGRISFSGTGVQRIATPLPYMPIEDMSNMFMNTAQLSEVCSALFSNNPNAQDFSGIFKSSNLITMPGDIFAGCVGATTFENAFQGNQNLREIPTLLFQPCANAENFKGTFQQTKITSAPRFPFNAKDFTACFFFTQNLKSIDADTFADATQATTFFNAFYTTGLLSIPPTLFDNNTQVTSFRGCFILESGWPNTMTGNAPELWARTPEPDGYVCFNNRTALANYAAIPLNWK